MDRYSSSRCLTSYLKSNVTYSLKSVMSVAFNRTAIQKVPSSSALYVKNLLDVSYAAKKMSFDFNIVKSMSSVAFDTTNEQEECLKNVCKKVCASTRAHQKSETTFMTKYLMPFIDTIILDGTDDSVEYSMTDGYDYKKRTKPDFMLGTEDRKRSVHFFYVEVKRPDIKSVHQEEDDYVKLLKQLKDSIDHQVKLGMSNPVSIGLLCEGFSCCIYMMAIVEEGVYLSSCLRKFQLVEDPSMILNVLPAFEVFWFIKVC
ncbi:hypothetical protein MBANPS3_012529 [Mucor bainieri]